MKRRTLTLDKRTGKYYARIQVDGVRKKFYFGKNRRKAEQDLRKLEAEVAEGKKSVAAIANPRVDRATPSDITIEELITRYLEWVEGNRAKSTYETKKSCCSPFSIFTGTAGCRTSTTRPCRSTTSGPSGPGAGATMAATAIIAK